MRGRANSKVKNFFLVASRVRGFHSAPHQHLLAIFFDPWRNFF
jgi:hypothetical protein